MKLSIYRYNPDTDAQPYMQDYEVALDAADRMLLDALVKVKAQDDTLAFRRSCREGVCGSDAMNINGKNRLACITKIAELPDHVTVRPMPGLPIIRDLVVDMTQFFKQYHSVRPYVINNDPPPERERLQSPEEREELNGLYVRRSGGTRTSSWVPRGCCRPTASSPTAGTRRPTSAWTTWRIRIASSAAIPS
jgi:succinate dehydrogenase / fumarate reductase iron-sulfur subunit